MKLNTVNYQQVHRWYWDGHWFKGQPVVTSAIEILLMCSVFWTMESIWIKTYTNIFCGWV